MSEITRYDPNYSEEMMEPDVDGRYVRWDCYLDAVKERDTLKAKYDDLAERNRNGVYVNELLELNATYLKERDAINERLRQSTELGLIDRGAIIRLSQDRDALKAELAELNKDLIRLKNNTGYNNLSAENSHNCMLLEALQAELAAAKKLASDLICENQGLKHKIDKMKKIDHYPRNAP